MKTVTPLQRWSDIFETDLRLVNVKSADNRVNAAGYTFWFMKSTLRNYWTWEWWILWIFNPKNRVQLMNSHIWFFAEIWERKRDKLSSFPKTCFETYLLGGETGIVLTRVMRTRRAMISYSHVWPWCRSTQLILRENRGVHGVHSFSSSFIPTSRRINKNNSPS